MCDVYIYDENYQANIPVGNLKLEEPRKQDKVWQKSLLKTESLDNAVLELWLDNPSRYMSHYTMLFKYGNWTRLLKIKNKLITDCFYK